MTAPPPTPLPSPTLAPLDGPAQAPTTTATTAVQGPVSTPGGGAHLPDGSDYIAIAAVLVALFALGYARRAANANVATVEEAKAANRLHADEIALIRQHRQEDQDRETAAATAATAARETHARAAAAAVTVQYGLNAGIDVVITNDSTRMIRDVRLVDLISTDNPGWRWRTNPNIPMGNSPDAARLGPGEHKTVACVFEDEHGRRQHVTGGRYGSHVRFTDADGQRWQIGEDTGPRQVSDDSDLADTATT